MCRPTPARGWSSSSSTRWRTRCGTQSASCPLTKRRPDMTLEERSQLNRFLNLLTQAQAGPKDAEAEALIAEAVRRQPDATYLLVQRVLQLEHALLEATKRNPSFAGAPKAGGGGGAPGAPRPPQPQPQQPPQPAQPQPMAQ